MAQSVPLPPPGFDELAVAEQIEYLQSLWDRIAADADQVPVPDWHRQVIQERLERDRNAPGEMIAWEQARDQVRAKLNDLRR